MRGKSEQGEYDAEIRRLGVAFKKFETLEVVVVVGFTGDNLARLGPYIQGHRVLPLAMCVYLYSFLTNRSYTSCLFSVLLIPRVCMHVVL